jgi:hypothetical protein
MLPASIVTDLVDILIDRRFLPGVLRRCFYLTIISAG